MDEHAPRGTHAIVDGAGAGYALLDDHLALQRIMEKALHGIGADIISVTSKRFHPQGCSIIALLAESHASIHTYPEHGVYMIDVFTCGDLPAADAARLMAVMIGGQPTLRSIPRGR